MPTYLRSLSLLSTVAVLSLAVLDGYPAAEPTKKVEEVKPPLSPEEAQKHFRLPPGLRIELVAAEPDVESPVAINFDEDGRLWIVEMRDYPNGPEKGKPPQGRIRILEDSDGKGRFYKPDDHPERSRCLPVGDGGGEQRRDADGGKPPSRNGGEGRGPFQGLPYEAEILQRSRRGRADAGQPAAGTVGTRLQHGGRIRLVSGNVKYFAV